jgi:hypothetical protein
MKLLLALSLSAYNYCCIVAFFLIVSTIAIAHGNTIPSNSMVESLGQAPAV